MVGYLKPNFKSKPKELKKEYKSFYCGICKAIKKKYSYWGLLSLNYELTAFLILLNSLQDQKQKTFHGSCSITPFIPVTYIDYCQEELVSAAHLSILIAYYEIKDNQYDIGGLKWNVLEKITTKKSTFAIRELDNKFNIIDSAISSYYSAEKNSEADFEDVLERDGRLIESFLSVLIKNDGTRTSKLLLKLANLLGQWIYLIDACDDYLDDIKKQNFNPLILLDDSENIEIIITSIENQIEETINSLPIRCYKELVDFIFIENLKETRKKVITNFKDNEYERVFYG